MEGEAIDITIGWVPPDITGVFKTATNFFELAAEDANKNGFNVKALTKSPTSSDKLLPSRSASSRT